MHLLLSVLLLPAFSVSHFLDLPKFKDGKYSKLLKLVEEFRESNKILITDNASIIYLDNFVSTMSSSSRGVVVINTDLRNNPSYPNDNSYLQLVFLKNISKYEIIQNNVKAFFKTVIIFIISENATQNICTIKGLTAFPKFEYSLTTSNLYTCRYNSENKTKTLHYGTMEESKNIYDIINRIHKSYHFNLKGHELVVAFDNTPPSISMRNISGKLQMVGIDYKILQAMSQKLNFKYTLKEFRGYNLTSSKSHALKELLRNRVDVVLGGLTLTSDRAMLFNFITPYQGTHFLAFYLMKSNRYSTIKDLVWNILVKTNSIPLLLLSAALFGCVLKISTLIFKDNNKKPPKHINVVFNILIGLSDPILNIYNNIPYKASIKVVLLFWLMMKVAIDVYFSAFFRAYLTSQDNTGDDIFSLINKGYTFVLNPNDHDYINKWCNHSILPLCDLFTYSSDKCENIMKPNHAIIIENFPSFVFVESLFNIRKYRDTERDISKCTFVHDSDLMLSSTEVFIGSGFQTFLLSKTSLYEPAFSNLMLKLLGAGIIQYWVAAVKRLGMFEEVIKYHSHHTSMKLDRLMFVFEIWLAGISCCFLVFLEEQRRFYFKNKQNRKKIHFPCGNTLENIAEEI